jgi:hypothetical protein
MKAVILFSVMIFAVAHFDAAQAQSAGKIVTPPAATESSRAASEAASSAAKDALKSDQKSEKMDEMKKKTKEAEDAMKKGKK